MTGYGKGRKTARSQKRKPRGRAWYDLRISWMASDTKEEKDHRRTTEHKNIITSKERKLARTQARFSRLSVLPQACPPAEAKDHEGPIGHPYKL
ncbi:uncharacterized protein Aud_004664 [Aspergillus udagawae]|uniref:Uncharacterized protein n=1 Tax=Aspergillus udagawae TaxID=91492 RepID=A0A8E0V007_9EURO|nr:uncharacterized protein Aud_004664 [Aspergillus udagawae]GIC88270.1 hypothetical protein Aud_004664 [Aspergillus udagawae]